MEIIPMVENSSSAGVRIKQFCSAVYPRLFPQNNPFVHGHFLAVPASLALLAYNLNIYLAFQRAYLSLQRVS